MIKFITQLNKIMKNWKKQHKIWINLKNIEAFWIYQHSENFYEVAYKYISGREGSGGQRFPSHEEAERYIEELLKSE